MALEPSSASAFYVPEPDVLVPPPPVVITPADPWPRPYRLVDGLRKVVPYHFTYDTFCKERWRGRKLLDIFACEFRDRSKEYYKDAIEDGHIAINGEPCQDTARVIKNGDRISHTLHRHEPPVTAQPIRVIAETDSLIVIDKPAGVPVHPAGRYKYNSVVEIMRAERHISFNPHPCNRLDRLTSGVMFIGKDKWEAERISEKLRSRTVRKEYIARVKGRFPDGENPETTIGGVVKCQENILQISPILGLNRVRASGKTAKTFFRRVAYYPPSTDQAEGYSIVHCLPLTGRTHQIRVHLQYLGHPIINDPIYANRRVFGSKLAIHDSSPAQDEEIKSRLAKMGKTEVADAIGYSNKPEQTMSACVPKEADESPTASGQDASKEPKAGSLPFNTTDEFDSFVAQHDEMVADYNKRKGEKMNGEKCSICDTPLYSDPSPEELAIYLHALSYSDLAGEWEYRGEVPSWALPPEEYIGPGPDREAMERETREILGRGWQYDGSETPPIEVDNKALNRQGMERNKR